MSEEATASPGITCNVALPVMFPEETVMSHRPVLVAKYSPWALNDPFSANQAKDPTAESGIS